MAASLIQLAGAVAMLSSPVAATNAAASFTAALSGPQAIVGKQIIDGFGSSHASTTLRATWRDHLAKTKADVDFNRVRFHGVFDDDMSTYLNGAANGALVFDTFDWLVQHGVAPTVELSFMPEQLASNPSETTFHYKGGTSLPANWTKWNTFVSQFVQLLVDRYTVDTVRSWRFEVWNEFNCNFLAPTNGCGPTSGNLTEYFQLYSNTAFAVKAVDARIPIGGPATAQLAYLPAFLDLVKAAGVPCDYVSSHIYPTDPMVPPNRDGFVTALQTAASQAAAGGVELWITEFNSGLGTQVNVSGALVPGLDTSYAGAFLLHSHLGLQSVANVPSLSFWTFTDFGFEEDGVDPVPYHNKFGVRSMYGVPKPSYRAMQMISAIGSAVPVTPTGSSGSSGGGRQYTNLQGGVVGATQGSVDVSVSVEGNMVTALLCSFELIGKAGPTAAAVTTDVTITFTGLSAAPAALPSTATLELYDATHASPYATWVAWGSPLYPNASEIAAEMAASQAQPQAVQLVATGAGAVNATVTLQPYSFARLTFTTN